MSDALKPPAPKRSDASFTGFTNAGNGSAGYVDLNKVTALLWNEEHSLTNIIVGDGAVIHAVETPEDLILASGKLAAMAGRLAS